MVNNSRREKLRERWAIEFRSPGGGDERLRAIVRSAARLFRENGFHQTSMDDLAASVGLAKPTVYHYVTSKQDVLYLIHEELFTELSAKYAEREGSVLSPEEGLLEIMVDMISILDARGDYLHVFFDYYSELSQDDRRIIEERRGEYEARVISLFEAGVSSGTFRQDVPIRMMVMAFFGVGNWAYKWYESDGKLSAREVASYLWEVVVGGVLAKGRTSPLNPADTTPGAGGSRMATKK